MKGKSASCHIPRILYYRSYILPAVQAASCSRYLFLLTAIFDVFYQLTVRYTTVEFTDRIHKHSTYHYKPLAESTIMTSAPEIEYQTRPWQPRAGAVRVRATLYCTYSSMVYRPQDRPRHQYLFPAKIQRKSPSKVGLTNSRLQTTTNSVNIRIFLFYLFKTTPLAFLHL